MKSCDELLFGLIEIDSTSQVFNERSVLEATLLFVTLLKNIPETTLRCTAYDDNEL